MRLTFWRAVLRGTVSSRALTIRMADGIDPRCVIWVRKIKPGVPDAA